MAASMITFGVLMFIFVGMIFFSWFSYVEKIPLGKPSKSYTPLIWWLLGIAALTRLIGAVSIVGYGVDIGCFTSWSMSIFERGIPDFYRSMIESKTFIDYPPGYMYALYIIGMLHKLLGISSSGGAHLILLKLPAMVCDLAVGWLIYKMARERFSQLAACALAFVYLFNPVVFIVSSLWGQVDSVFVLLILLCFYYMYKEKLLWAGALFGIAFLVKPQALLLGPVLLWFVVEKLRKDANSNLIPILKFVGAGIVSFFAAALPFTAGYGFQFGWLIGNPADWLSENPASLYAKTLSSYAFGSVNAFNFFALLGGNWKKVEEIFFLFNFNVWSNIFIAVSVVASGFIYFKYKDSTSKGFITGAFINIAIFVLAAKMHERYMMPAVALLLVAYIMSKDKRLLYIYGAFSLSSMLNVAYVLGDALVKPSILWFKNNDPTVIISALINIACLVYFAYITFKTQADVSAGNAKPSGTKPLSGGKTQVKPKVNYGNVPKSNSKSEPLKPQRTAVAPPPAPQNPLLYYTLLLVLTIAYTIVAFYQLGDRQAPETYWQNKFGDSVVLKLASPATVDKINIYHGQTISKYRYEISNDGVTWTNVADAEKGYVFQWVEQPVDKTAAYVKLTAIKPSNPAYLHEVEVFEKGTQKLLPIVSVTDKEGNPVKELTDEQNIVVYKPTLMNGTYFDEIYHARTAWENLHNMEPTETSHPPLGKYIIALGVHIFGMNPFGWRFMGTLFGVLIIPAFFALAQVLFKNYRYSLIAATLMALDFMHFTQTRIATIDSYSIFFIIMMYIFMFKYYQMSFYETDVKRTLIPLFWCGIFFGLGAATKWICIYAGLGLATLFIISIVKRFNEYNKHRYLKGPTSTAIKKAFTPNFITTLICGAVFLGAIPFCIYLAAYYPFAFITTHPYDLGDVFSYQKSMFAYHSGLTATHPYSSPWYGWPWLFKPMWYYSGTPDANGITGTITAFGNPLIWWVGTLAFWAGIPFAVKAKDKRLIMLIIGYLSQYFPWWFVTRVVFIYHYFAATVFAILMIVFLIYHLEKASAKLKYVTYGYLALALLLFIVFFPVISGVPVEKSYLDSLRNALHAFGINYWTF